MTAIKTHFHFSFIYLSAIAGIIRIIAMDARTIGTPINCCYKCWLSTGGAIHIHICSSSTTTTTTVILVIKAIILFIIVIMIVIRCICVCSCCCRCLYQTRMCLFFEGMWMKINSGTVGCSMWNVFGVQITRTCTKLQKGIKENDLQWRRLVFRHNISPQNLHPGALISTLTTLHNQRTTNTIKTTLVYDTFNIFPKQHTNHPSLTSTHRL